jgi:hypothetical protein
MDESPLIAAYDLFQFHVAGSTLKSLTYQEKDAGKE